MNTLVLAQIAKRGEKFYTTWLFTFKGGTIMHPLVGLQTVECGEIFLTTNNVTAIWAIFSMNSDMNLKAMRI